MAENLNPDSTGFLLTDVARMLRHAFERRIGGAGLGLTAGEARALLQVAACQGARQTVIAERMGVEPMTLCAYLDRLEQLDLVTRLADPADKRAKNISTTPKAADMIVAIRRHSSALMDEVQADLSDDARHQINTALITMRANLRDLMEPSA